MELQLASVLLLFTFLFLFIILKYWKQPKSKYSNPKLPPGPMKLPVIGNIHNLIGPLPHHALRNLAKKHGPIMHLKLGEVSTVVISSPEAAKEVMKTHDLKFASRPEFLLAKIISYGCTGIISSPYGEYWRQLRKICILELLSTKRVESFRSIREEEVWNFIENIYKSSGIITINLSQMISSLTNAITSRTAFGTKCEDGVIFLSVMKEAIKLGGGFDIHDIFPSLKFLHFFSGVKPTLEIMHQRIDKILDRIIDDHRMKRRESIHKPTDEDLVDVLLKVQESGDLEFPITTNNIKAVILDIFIAGIDTSATTLEWAMSELIRNPRVMEKAQAEVREMLKGKNKIQETDIEKLNYMKFVIKETLRLHPPGPLLVPRETRERCEINGYEIPIKTKVIVNGWAIGRDPEFWSNPECFEPERFDGSSINFTGTNFQYIPFGAGRRMCPGMTFGIANIELPLAVLLFHFDWKLPNGCKPEELDMTESFGATIRKTNELQLIVTPYIPLIQGN